MKLFIFDIETGALPEERILEIAPEFRPESVKVGNLGIEKAQGKINAARDHHVERIVDRAALHGEYGEVLAIGTAFCHDDENQETKQGGQIFLQNTEAPNPEGAVIEKFWQLAEEAAVRGHRLVGHNIFKFDLPFLVRRSYALDIKPPTILLPNRGRYWGHPWFDTLSAWSLGDYQEMISLDRFAKHLGLEGKNGDGKHFSKLLKENPTEATEYLANDLKVTLNVAKRIVPLLEGTEVGL